MYIPQIEFSGSSISIGKNGLSSKGSDHPPDKTVENLPSDPPGQVTCSNVTGASSGPGLIISNNSVSSHPIKSLK